MSGRSQFSDVYSRESYSIPGVGSRRGCELKGDITILADPLMSEVLNELVPFDKGKPKTVTEIFATPVLV